VLVSAFLRLIPYFRQQLGFYSGILQTHFPYSHQLMKNKLSVALFTAAFGYNFNRKVINYSYFAPGIDVDSSFAWQKVFHFGLFSLKNQFQKKYHVVRYVVQPSTA
jgi:hypothetical protein